MYRATWSSGHDRGTVWKKMSAEASEEEVLARARFEDHSGAYKKWFAFSGVKGLCVGIASAWLELAFIEHP